MLLRYVGSQKLSEMLQQPYDLFKPGWADHYILGMVNQVNIWMTNIFLLDGHYILGMVNQVNIWIGKVEIKHRAEGGDTLGHL